MAKFKFRLATLLRLREATRDERRAGLAEAFRAAAGCDVALVVGTSGVVQPAASLAVEAKRGGATVIEVNLDETPNTGWVDIALTGKAGEIVPELVD